MRVVKWAAVFLAGFIAGSVTESIWGRWNGTYTVNRTS